MTTLNTPTAPPGSTLTAAADLRVGDRVTGGTGSRYKGPEFTVTFVEKFYAFMSPHMLVEVRGDAAHGPVRLPSVPATTAYRVTREETP